MPEKNSRPIRRRTTPREATGSSLRPRTSSGSTSSPLAQSPPPAPCPRGSVSRPEAPPRGEPRVRSPVLRRSGPLGRRRRRRRLRPREHDLRGSPRRRSRADVDSRSTRRRHRDDPDRARLLPRRHPRRQPPTEKSLPRRRSLRPNPDPARSVRSSGKGSTVTAGPPACSPRQAFRAGQAAVRRTGPSSAPTPAAPLVESRAYRACADRSRGRRPRRRRDHLAPPRPGRPHARCQAPHAVASRGRCSSEARRAHVDWAIVLAALRAGGFDGGSMSTTRRSHTPPSSSPT